MVESKFMRTSVRNNQQKGFTLIELLVVIGILAILLTMTLVAINPARNFSTTNNSKRASDTNQILSAITQYMADSKGVLPAPLAAGETRAISSVVSATTTGAAFCTALVPKYIAALPKDPTSTSKWTDCATHAIGYSIVVSTPLPGDTARITVFAPSTELAVPTIQVTR